MTELHPFDELHAIVHEAYQRDDAVRYKLDAWLRKNDPRPDAEWPEVSRQVVQVIQIRKPLGREPV